MSAALVSSSTLGTEEIPNWTPCVSVCCNWTVCPAAHRIASISGLASAMVSSGSILHSPVSLATDEVEWEHYSSECSSCRSLAAAIRAVSRSVHMATLVMTACSCYVVAGVMAVMASPESVKCGPVEHSVWISHE